MHFIPSCPSTVTPYLPIRVFGTRPTLFIPQLFHNQCPACPEEPAKHFAQSGRGPIVNFGLSTVRDLECMMMCRRMTWVAFAIGFGLPCLIIKSHLVPMLPLLLLPDLMQVCLRTFNRRRNLTIWFLGLSVLLSRGTATGDARNNAANGVSR
jgi:hypothetical protein